MELGSPLSMLISEMTKPRNQAINTLQAPVFGRFLLLSVFCPANVDATAHITARKSFMGASRGRKSEIDNFPIFGKLRAFRDFI